MIGIRIKALRVLTQFNKGMPLRFIWFVTLRRFNFHPPETIK